MQVIARAPAIGLKEGADSSPTGVFCECRSVTTYICHRDCLPILTTIPFQSRIFDQSDLQHVIIARYWTLVETTTTIA